jgi:hypothetical protein
MKTRIFLLNRVMDIQKIIKDNSRFLAITTLNLSEFEELLIPFSERWRKYIKHRDFRGKRRKKPLMPRQIKTATTHFRKDEERLFFILYFFKNKHLQQSLSAQFDINQGQISRWIHVLMPILEQTIIDLHLQPARTMDELIKLFRLRQEKNTKSQCGSAESLHLDVTERRIGRSCDYETQAKDYSGKQGTHTIKNSVINDEWQFIHFAGQTFRGAIHDKKMATIELPNLSALSNWNLFFSKDKAYQKYEPEGVQYLAPFKATRNNPLNDVQIKFNALISSIRIVSKHAIGGIKRCRINKDKLRYFEATFRDKIFSISCGLHNLRITRRKIDYLNSAMRTRARTNLNFSHT